MEIFLKITSLDAFMHDTLERGGRALSAQIPMGREGNLQWSKLQNNNLYLGKFFEAIFRKT
jgi:hypothetical protein